MKWTKRKIFRLVYVTAGICFLGWMWFSMQANNIADNFLRGNQLMNVTETNDLISFTPSKDYTAVFIFFPGALVDPVAYAPLCRQIADNGYKVQLVKMPWRLASKGYNKPTTFKLFSDTTKTYILSGHSQGAKMAAQFVYENPGLVDQLILIGTTHPRDIDLSGIKIPVMKISGSKDGVANAADVNTNKPKLPANTNYVVIEGANHAQFGYYGSQLGDDKATINRQEQHQIVLSNILSFISNFLLKPAK
jgi:hypothetical protein